MAEVWRRRKVWWLRLDRDSPGESEWAGEMWAADYAGYLVALDSPSGDVKVGIGSRDRAEQHEGVVLAEFRGGRLAVCEWEQAVLDGVGFGPAGCVDHLRELTAGGWTEVRSSLVVGRAVELAGVFGLSVEFGCRDAVAS